MGYTHYWDRNVGSQISLGAWEKIRADASTLVAAAPCELLREYDEPGTTPEVDGDHIRFNGRGHEEGHETFMIERIAPEQKSYRRGEQDIVDFCKTSYKPYDRIVCGVLAVIAQHDPSVKISSDGGRADWQPALEWAGGVLGRKLAFPCRDKDDAKT